MSDETGATIVSTTVIGTTVVANSRSGIVLTTPVRPSEVIPDDELDILVLDRVGPRGPEGPAGPRGATGVGEQGEQGIPGRQGDPGELTVYRHVQLSPEEVWDVHHTLHSAYPKVGIILSDGSVAEGDVDYLGVDHLTITFTTAVAGEAWLT